MQPADQNANSANAGLVDLTVNIVSAYVAHNALSLTDLPKLIQDVHTSLGSLSAAKGAAAETAVDLKPAVPVRSSITDDYIICLEDGKKFKSLKRHLSAHFGMTPEQYREKWNLKPDYPMVAKNYSSRRSQLARDNGLGRSKK